MALFVSIENEVKEAFEKLKAQFPGSNLGYEIKDKVVTLKGVAPDVATKGMIMQAFSALVPDAGNVINLIRAEHPGAVVPPPPAAAGAVPPMPMPNVIPEAAPAKTAMKTYTVVKGDTLSAIAKKLYGHASEYMKIFDANKDVLKDPNKIFPGQVLKIPD